MADDHRKPLARYGAMKSALREQLAPAQLHHQPGHDRRYRAGRGRAFTGAWIETISSAPRVRRRIHGR
jgi:hypothetical protein